MMERNSFQLRNGDSTNSTVSTIDYNGLREIRNDVTELKSIIKQLQKEHISGLSNSAAVEDALSELRASFQRLDSIFVTLTPLAMVRSLQQDLQHNIDQLRKNVSDFEQEFRFGITQNIDAKIEKIRIWFHEVQETLKSKQQKLYSQMDSLAQKCDLSALHQNVHDDFMHLQNRFDRLDRNLAATATTFQFMRRESAVKILSHFVTRKNESFVSKSWKRWRHRLHMLNELERKTSQQRGKMRKLLLRTFFGRKVQAWKRWRNFAQSMEQLEERQKQATQYVRSGLQRVTTLSMTSAFRIWRRSTISARRRDVAITFSRQLLSNQPTVDEHEISDRMRATYKHSEERYKAKFSCDDIGGFIHAFKNDHEGGMMALVEELSNIRSIDIINLHHEIRSGEKKWCDELSAVKETWRSEFQTSTHNFSEAFSAQSRNYDLQFLDAKNLSVALQKSVKDLVLQLNDANRDHSEKIEVLQQANTMFKERELTVNRRICQLEDKMRQLEYDNVALKEKVHSLEEKVGLQETEWSQVQDRNRNAFICLQKDVDSFYSFCKDTGSSLNDNHEQINALRNEQIQTKISLDAKVDSITDSLSLYGVRKPNMSRIIQDGVIYEATSKEKNYTVPMNCIMDGDGDIDLVGHIASFAFDYAAWIAFQVDIEMLQCVVVGRNPDELVYAIDETSEKRKFFLGDLRTRLESRLEETHPHPGTIRLEARMKFVTRLMDAIDAALSKHDQVSIPLTARLTRVRASVPTCVACDRPLRMKDKVQTSNAGILPCVGPTKGTCTNTASYNGTHNFIRGAKKIESDKTESVEFKRIIKTNHQSSQLRLSFADDKQDRNQLSMESLESKRMEKVPQMDEIQETTNFVMRGGFKMPR